MKIGTEDLQEIMEMIGVADTLKPVAEEAVKKVQMFGPELKALATGFAEGVADVTIAAYRRYKDNGFSHEEAIVLASRSFDFIKYLKALKGMNKD